LRNRSVEAVEIFVTRNLDRSETGEMGCDELRIQQLISAVDQSGDQMDERDLACVGFAAEHALAEERGAERNTVEAAYKVPFAPAFDRMRAAAGVESCVESKDLVVDPALFAPRRRFRAGAHDVHERNVRSYVEPVAAHGTRETLGDVEGVQRNDPALLRRNPIEFGGVALFRHREHAIRVGAQYDFGCQASAAVHLMSLAQDRVH